ncbi:MAG: aldo/keto reductase [Bacteroidota bacterium]
MENRPLGNSQLNVSEISLGCMSFHTREQGVPILQRALDLGITTFDTADLYDKGENEKIVGEALKAQRSSVIIATKVGNRWRENGDGWDWVPRKDYLLRAVEDSLRRLQTDYIDLYQLHGGTVADPLEEVIEAFELLQTQGKIRAYGISSIRPNTIRKWTNLSRGASCMTQYSLLDRRPEETTLGQLSSHQHGVLVRGALAKGLLIDRPARDYVGRDREAVANLLADYQARVPLSARAGQAVAYALAHPAVSSVVLGASHPTQLEEVIQSWRATTWTDDEQVGLRSIFPAHFYDQHR